VQLQRRCSFQLLLRALIVFVMRPGLPKVDPAVSITNLKMRFFQTPLSKFVILLAVCAAGIFWLYTIAPPPPPREPFQVLPEWNSGMRYCFAEEIRLGAGRFVLEQGAKSADIERFNRMVDAYNQRCSNLREKRRNFGIVEGIQSEVRANRDALWAEGIARFPAAGR
jgi:hypothetical protein